MKASTFTFAFLLLPIAVSAQTSLSLNQSQTGNGTGVWTTLPACSGPSNALIFDSANQSFGCNTMESGDLAAGQHLVVEGDAPSITAGSGAGTNPSVSLSPNSTDSAGWISVTTGKKPTRSGTIVTVTASAPVKSGDSWNCGIAPANDEAAGVNPYIPMPAVSSSSFDLVAVGNSMDASTTYLWRYWCVELE